MEININMFTQEADVITNIALQPFMQESLVLHECAKGRMHVNIWQHAGLNCKAQVVCLGAGLGQAIAKTHLCPNMGKVVNGA